MPSQIIPCEDCADAKRRFEERRFRVLGCERHPNRDGMCVISFERLAGPAADAMSARAAADAVVSPPSISSTQVSTAQAIVNVFETSEVRGRYDSVTLLPGDTGRLTYGRSQTTLGSGNLGKLIADYCQNAGARFSARLKPYLPQFQSGDAALDRDSKLHNLLRACADDPVMRDTQDAFFDRAYWQPAVRAAHNLGVLSPLAVAVVYDSQVHGSWPALRDFTNKNDGTLAQLGEQAWIGAYVRNRREWLATHKTKILRNTTYRMDAFQRLIDLGQWGLALPLVVRGKEISAASLLANPPGCYEGPALGSRPLGLQQPMLSGLDVRQLQLVLSDLGSDIVADGVFGKGSVSSVKQLQIARNLPVTGVVDLDLIGKLV